MKEVVSPSSFLWNVRESYASVAERAGVDEETVRRGLQRVQQFGILQGWQLVLNSHLIGHESASIVLETDDVERKPTAISQIKLIQGVVFIFDFHGNGLQVVVYYNGEKDLARKIQLIGSIFGSKEEPMHWKGGLPSCDLDLKKIDWQIIKAMQKDPRRRLAEIANEIKVSTRTVKRRLTVLTDGNAFFSVPRLNIAKAPGVNCRFIVFCPDENKKRRVDELIRSRPERIVFAHTGAKQYSAFTILCNNISEANEIHGWMNGLDGVKDVRMGIMKDFIVVDDWLDEEIEKRAR
jgi:DNA-binding Lrp family transcriptional regulator